MNHSPLDRINEDILNLDTPIVPIENEAVRESGIKIYMKRDDLIHPLICGNKWRKLKYNLVKAIANRKDTILSYGGAFSNHLVALACASHHLRLRSVGIIRSHSSSVTNPSIRLMQSFGMKLHFVNPSAYILKEKSGQVQNIVNGLKRVYIIPEGGTNALAIKGVREIWNEIEASGYHFDFIVCPVGTGGTLAGIVDKAPRNVRVIGFTLFRNMVVDLPAYAFFDPNNHLVELVRCEDGLKFGGYSKNIVAFINSFYDDLGILLDPIYTARSMIQLLKLIRNRRFVRGSSILFLHTGGIQGVLGYNYLSGHKARIVVPSGLCRIFNITEE